MNVQDFGVKVLAMFYWRLFIDCIIPKLPESFCLFE